MSKTKVVMLESERGWGSRIDEVLEFDTYEEAVEYAKKYNQKYNNQKEVPDWYIVAQIDGVTVV